MATQMPFLVEVLVAAFVLWLGLYSITRDLPWRHETERLWQRPPLLTGTGLVLGSLYFFGNAMKMVSTRPEEFIRWQQMTLWGVPIAVSLFFIAVVELTYWGHRPARWLEITGLIAFGVAVVLAAAIASGYLFDHAALRTGNSPLEPYYLPLRVHFGDFYYGFVVAGILGSITALILYLRRTEGRADRRQKALLGIAGGAFLLAGLMATYYFSELNNRYLPAQIGDLVAVIGALAVSFDIVRHNALQHQHIIESDFWHSYAGVTVTVLAFLVGYLLLTTIFAYQAQPLAVVVISVVIVLTHTPYNWGDAVLDRLFLPRWVVGYREQLHLMRQLPLKTADPEYSLSIAEQTFDAVLQTTRTNELESLIQDEIEEIFKYRNFNDDGLLSDSRLFNLGIAQAALENYANENGLLAGDLSQHQRAECVRGLLRSAINDWSWSHKATPRRENMERLILREKYVEQRTRVDVERLLSDQFEVVITGGGYSRRLKKARQDLAQVLLERELAYASLEQRPSTAIWQTFDQSLPV